MCESGAAAGRPAKEDERVVCLMGRPPPHSVPFLLGQPALADITVVGALLAFLCIQSIYRMRRQHRHREASMAAASASSSSTLEAFDPWLEEAGAAVPPPLQVCAGGMID